jgi:cell division protein FtsW (lipid II flippase)
MYTGLLHLHNTLRWVVLIALILSIYKLFTQKDALKTSKILLISAHVSLLVGLYQYIAGPLGIKLIQSAGMGATMKDASSRFWAVEHIFSMILAIVLITIGHLKYKKTLKPSPTRILYVVALILILLAIPWPFREGIGRPLFPGMG